MGGSGSRATEVNAEEYSPDPARPAEPLPPASQTEDHRQRAARRRRESMRQRLLQAALDVFLQSDMIQPPVIDDVIRRAQVARGTFYKYFVSLEQVLEALGQQMADAMLDRYTEVFRELHDPAARLAAGPLLSLTQAAQQPRRVNFTARVNYVDFLSRNPRVSQVISDCLEQARASGVARVASLEAMTDLIIGTTLEGCRRLLHADAGGAPESQAYIDALVLMMLQACGLTPARARQAIARAQVQLSALACTDTAPQNALIFPPQDLPHRSTP